VAVRAAEREVAEIQRQISFVERAPVHSWLIGDGGLAKYRAVLAVAQQRLTTARVRLESLELQARREAIPPGWLR
jgi:hypothetical protein